MGRGGRGGACSAVSGAPAGAAVRLAAAGPGAASYAGGAWTAGTLVRVGGRHCAGRETTPARAWRELEVDTWCALSEGRYAPSSPFWLRRSGRQKARRPQLCRHLPKGSCKVWGQLRSPHTSQRGSPQTGQRSPRTPKAAGCVAPAASASDPVRQQGYDVPRAHDRSTCPTAFPSRPSRGRPQGDPGPYPTPS